MRPVRVILLPGAVLPAALAYEALILALGHRVEAVAKDLELYRSPRPPDDYGLGHEVTGVIREADERGWGEFHLVGYSAGGAAALATVAANLDRVLSLGLLEPAWAGNWSLGKRETAVRKRYEELRGLPPSEFMAAFVRVQLRPGVEPPPPPPGPPPEWMAKRPGGIAALTTTFGSSELDREALQRFERPVYYALGGLSNPDQYLEIAHRLQEAFSDFSLEIFEGRHHFDPPHRIEPERLARSLESHCFRPG